MRYIDADALKERMLNYYECVNSETCKSNYRGETLMAYEVADLIEDCIDNAPTVDAVPVVRCEECEDRYACPRKLKMFRGFDGYGKRLYKNVTVNSCEYGKRRNDGEKL